jgi:general secretion pathway protein J
VSYRSRGFTLVELLIALVMLSIITLLLFSGLRLGSRAWEGVETVSERSADLRLALNIIERGLRQARAVELRLEGRRLTVFTGEPERLEFVAPLAAHVGIPGLYILRLELEDSGTEFPRLMLTRWLLHPDVLNGEGDAPAWEPLAEASGFGRADDSLDQDLAAGAQGRTLLVPAVARFELSYYGVPQGAQAPEWLDEWIDETQLPARVRIELTTPEQSWPATLVTLPGPARLAEPL